MKDFLVQGTHSRGVSRLNVLGTLQSLAITLVSIYLVVLDVDSLGFDFSGTDASWFDKRRIWRLWKGVSIDPSNFHITMGGSQRQETASSDLVKKAPAHEYGFSLGVAAAET